VLGLCLAVEGYNIVNGWEGADETMSSESALAGLKSGYVNGDLKFDPLGLKPKNAKDLKVMQTKEINNGRLAMLAVAGLVAQELVSNAKTF
jgi:light-harvesting complex I chlorophyll a/b binding protein 1